MRNAARNSILNGNSKEATFASLRGQVDMDEEALAKMIQAIPSLDQRERTKGLHITFIILLGVVSVLKLILVIPMIAAIGGTASVLLFIFPLINFALLWGVIKYTPGLHSLVAILTMFSIFRSLRHIGESGGLDTFGVILALALIILGFYLNRQLFPKLVSEESYVTDQQGQTEARMVYRFTEY